jgi:cadmium resistance protein CadD (predicted permease)
MEFSTTLLSTIAIGITVFAVTNIDDILLLAAFFSDARLKRRNILIGQFLGIAALVAASSAAAALALVVPQGWIALLGFAPLLLGLRGLLALWRSNTPDVQDNAVREEHAIEDRTHSQVFAVAAVTIANGGDNLGVYIPLFASQMSAIPLYVVVFAAMTVLWCALGYALVSNRWIGEFVTRIARWALPFVLIGLGLHILSGALVLL